MQNVRFEIFGLSNTLTKDNCRGTARLCFLLSLRSASIQASITHGAGKRWVSHAQPNLQDQNQSAVSEMEERRNGFGGAGERWVSQA
jgi:hypothetical protein